MNIDISNNYELLHWKDRIWKIGPGGKLIPKRDSNNQIIVNPLTGQPEYETIEDGTRVSAGRLNHMDEGIYNNYELLVQFQRMLKKIQMQLELDGRVPGSNGNFVDTFDELPTRMTRLSAKTEVTAAVTAGNTIIPVANASQFKALQLVTIYDANSYEHVKIGAVNAEANKLTVTGVVNDYSKGAKVARSTAGVDAVDQSLVVAPFTAFQVELVEVV